MYLSHCLGTGVEGPLMCTSSALDEPLLKRSSALIDVSKYWSKTTWTQLHLSVDRGDVKMLRYFMASSENVEESRLGHLNHCHSIKDIDDVLGL